MVCIASARVKVCTYVVYKDNISRVPSIPESSCPSPLMHSSVLYKQRKADTLFCKKTMCENMEHTFEEAFRKPSGQSVKDVFWQRLRGRFRFGKACCDPLFPFLSKSVVLPLNFITSDFLPVKRDVHISALSFIGPSSSTKGSLSIELLRGKNTSSQ